MTTASPAPDAPDPHAMSGDPRRAVLPGSYDPFTNGHLDIVTRASRLYDEVVVAVLHNPDKRGTFSPQERRELIEASTADLPNVRAATFGDRLIVDVCRDLDAGVLVKGLRGTYDYDYELPMALMNRQVSGVETVLLPGDPALGHYSSSLIRVLATHGADVGAMVPDPVAAALAARLGEG